MESNDPEPADLKESGLPLLRTSGFPHLFNLDRRNHRLIACREIAVAVRSHDPGHAMLVNVVVQPPQVPTVNRDRDYFRAAEPQPDDLPFSLRR